MKKLVLFFLFLPLIAISQKEIAAFSLDANHHIEPQLSFSFHDSHYILGGYKEINPEGKYEIKATHILEFDKNYNYVGIRNLRFKNIESKNIYIKHIILKKDSLFTITFLNKTKESFEHTEGILNIKTLKVSDLNIKYSIPLPKKIKSDFFKLVAKNKNIYIFHLLTKNKTLKVYSLSDNSYSVKSFPLEKDYFNRLKPNFRVLVEGGISNNFLDVPNGHQYYINDNFVYLITGGCKKGIPSLNSINSATDCISSEFYSPVQIIKMNLETGQVIHKKIMTDKIEIAFSTLDNKLFYTFGNYNHLFINILNLDDFTEQSFRINEKSFNNFNLVSQYTNYKIKATKTKTENVGFRKLYEVFKKQPSLSVKKMNDSIYNIKLGNVKYKSYKNFGDWFSTFAIATITSNLSLDADTGNYYTLLVYSKNEIPVIYHTEFSVNTSNKKIAKKNIAKTTSIRAVMLNNIGYFLKKRVVSPIETVAGKEPHIFLFRNKNNWKNFYIYNFEQ